jgi:hypothetical protein
MPNAIWYEAMIPGVATSMAATTAEVITATGIFCIAMKYVPVNIKTIHEYHFWDPGLMARLAQLRKFTPYTIVFIFTRKLSLLEAREQTQ